MKIKSLIDGLRWLGSRPFWAAFFGTVAGVAAYAALHLAASISWIEGHPGLASWVQAVGSVAALAWGVWLYRKSLQDRKSEIFRLEEENRKSLRAVFKLYDSAIKSTFDAYDKALHSRRKFTPWSLVMLEGVQLALRRVLNDRHQDHKIFLRAVLANNDIATILDSINSYNDDILKYQASDSAAIRRAVGVRRLLRSFKNKPIPEV